MTPACPASSFPPQIAASPGGALVLAALASWPMASSLHLYRVCLPAAPLRPKRRRQRWQWPPLWCR